MFTMFKNGSKLVTLSHSKVVTLRSAHTGIENSKGILSPENLSRVVVACISGRDGVEGGMQKLRNKLRETLMPMGVNPDFIFTRSWNHGRGDTDPSGAPNVQDLKNEIFSRAKIPSYLAIIGHSYGGWASAKVSRSLFLHNRINAHFVGLVDPVFGPANSIGPDDYPKGHAIKNWWQDNGINNIEVCSGTTTPCSSSGGGIACGYQNVEGAQSIHENYKKDWGGDRNRVWCPQGHKYILAVHDNMDDNQWIWRQIYNKISEDLHKLKFVNLAELDDIYGNGQVIEQQEVEQRNKSNLPK